MTKKLVVFFTWDVSVELWARKGLLQREIRIYERLTQNDVDVTFLSWGGDEDREFIEQLPKAIRVISLYKYLPRPSNKALRALCSLLAPWVLRKELRQADILKTNQMWGAWVAAISKLTSRTPMILRCGFELYDFTVRQNHSFPRRAFTWCISRFSYALADHICVATKDDKKVVTDIFGQLEAKISVHPNWIDTNFFSPRNVAQKEGHLLFVGRLSQQKNIPALIEAIAGTDFTLDMIGAGDMQEELEAQAKAQGAKVNFLGTRPNDQLPDIYSSYPVYILPSFYEGNPKTLLEAMSCASAVIGTNVSGIASLLQHRENGLVAETDALSLRQAITDMMGDPDLRQKLGAAARKQIQETQTLDALVSKELACYQRFDSK
ncbi:MAG: glycosyltransferase family 4 protein [Cohaesibacter sp.]|nr:glycosyltransferase family 4 protein [Cohaesibacter sp.]